MHPGADAGFPSDSDHKESMQETWILYLDWEDALGKRMTAHCFVLARRFLWTEEPGGLAKNGMLLNH